MSIKDLLTSEQLEEYKTMKKRIKGGKVTFFEFVTKTFKLEI